MTLLTLGLWTTAASQLAADFDAASWAPAANTALLIVLAIFSRRTTKTAGATRKELAAAREDVNYHTRVVKESHNALVDVLTRKYEDSPDAGSYKFERRGERRGDDERELEPE